MSHSLKTTILKLQPKKKVVKAVKKLRLKKKTFPPPITKKSQKNHFKSIKL